MQFGLLEARIKKLKPVPGSRETLDSKGWMSWRTWKDTCEVYEDVYQREEDDAMGALTRSVRIERRARIKGEIARLRRQKKHDRRDRLRAGAGDCREDCIIPGLCTSVLTQAMKEEKEMEERQGEKVVETQKEAEDLETANGEEDSSQSGVEMNSEDSETIGDAEGDQASSDTGEGEKPAKKRRLGTMKAD